MVLKLNFTSSVKNILFVSFLAGMASCSDIDSCDANDEQNFMVLDFHRLESRASLKVGFRVTSGDEVFGEGVYEDGDYAYSEDSTSINLPLDPNSETTSFQFESDTSSFEITLGYEINVSIFDPDCPPSFFYSGLDTLSHSFDSLSIPGTITNSQIETNVEVYF